MFFFFSVVSTLEGTFYDLNLMYCKDCIITVIISFFSKTFFFTLQEANHETMIISYDVTSCAKLKCIVSCLNFAIEDNFIDGECLMIHMKHAVNTI